MLSYPRFSFRPTSAIPVLALRVMPLLRPLRIRSSGRMLNDRFAFIFSCSFFCCSWRHEVVIKSWISLLFSSWEKLLFLFIAMISLRSSSGLKPEELLYFLSVFVGFFLSCSTSVASSSFPSISYQLRAPISKQHNAEQNVYGRCPQATLSLSNCTSPFRFLLCIYVINWLSVSCSRPRASAPNGIQASDTLLVRIHHLRPILQQDE